MGLPPGRRRYLAAECLSLFFLLPPAMYLLRHVLAFRVVPLVMVLAEGAAWLLRRQPGWDRRTLTGLAQLRAQLPSILKLLIPAGFALALAAWLWLPEHWLRFPRTRPGAWLLVMILYPLLTAYPQEILFRAFFFRRYGRLFASRAWLTAANGLSFGLAHAFYGNWVAVALATVGRGAVRLARCVLGLGHRRGPGARLVG